MLRFLCADSPVLTTLWYAMSVFWVLSGDQKSALCHSGLTCQLCCGFLLNISNCVILSPGMLLTPKIRQVSLFQSTHDKYKSHSCRMLILHIGPPLAVFISQYICWHFKSVRCTYSKSMCAWDRRRAKRNCIHATIFQYWNVLRMHERYSIQLLLQRLILTSWRSFYMAATNLNNSISKFYSPYIGCWWIHFCVCWINV